MEMIKKIIKNYFISFLGFYLPNLILVILGFLFNTQGTYLIDFTGVAILISFSSVVYSFFSSIVLGIFSLTEKIFTNKWVVFAFSLYWSIVFLIFTGFGNNNLWFIESNWLFTIILLVPLVITLIFMKFKKWFKN